MSWFEESDTIMYENRSIFKGKGIEVVLEAMWMALGMYALKETWKEKKMLRKMRSKNKEERLRQIIIPGEAFYSDTSFLPTFDEVKVQEELPDFYDPKSTNKFSEYDHFEYSMGGKLKMYENHIALSSPKRKIKKPTDSPYKEGLDYERTKLESSTDLTSDILSETMDTSSKGGNDEVTSGGRRCDKHGDDIDFGTSNVRASIENLNISDMPSRLSRRGLRDSDSCDDISIRRSEASHTERDYSPIRDGSTRMLDRHGDFSTTESKNDTERDYSPVHSTEQVLQETREYYKAKSNLTAKGKTDVLESAAKVVSGDTGSHSREKTKNDKDINVLESLSRYDLTLNYVNQQNMTLQNGDYNDLDIALSDLSSDLFTDSELAVTIPESGEWTRNRPQKIFYPDSPTSECAFFKTPCSSRKNSLDSSLSEESMSDKEPDIRGKIEAPVRRSIVTNGHNGYTNGVSKVKTKGAPVQNGKPKSPLLSSKKPDLKNVQPKVGSTNNRNYKPGSGKGKITTKKIDYSRNVKSKVDSFRNINHVPGGGNKKIANGRINNYKHVETRTDTHGIEAYSHLPAEFQEIARRLARQDKDLRDVTGGGSRPRSRLSSRSSRGDSPRERSPDRSDNLAKHSGLSLSSTSLTSGTFPKKRKNPSLHPRPVTPSLSRSHPATSCTLYDSRSRPSSRQASRSSSPVRSRNSSPSRGRRSRTSSPTNTRTSRSKSPSRSRNSRRSSVSGGSSYGAPAANDRSTSRSKTPSRSSSRSRLDDARPPTPVMDILSYSTSRSLFQVVPVNR